MKQSLKNQTKKYTTLELLALIAIAIATFGVYFIWMLLLYAFIG